MAQGKLTPRQKMINLMYLVFIAMLAMQIDQEIIRSYNDTKGSLEQTRLLTQDKNKIFEQTLLAKSQNAPDTFTVPYQQYKSLQSQTNDLVSILDKSKKAMYTFADYKLTGKDDSFDYNALNNTDASTHYFFQNSNEGKPSNEATVIIEKINNLREYIINNFGQNPQMKQVVERAQKSLVTISNDKNRKDWLTNKFYNQPLVAALANVEVLQTEARNIESDVLANLLQEKVDANIKFDAYKAIVSAPTTVIQGEVAEAKVAIGNYSSSVPGLSMPGLSVQNGQGSTNLNTSVLGDHTFGGTITFNDANGKAIPLTYNHTYKVIAGAQELKAQKGAILTADKMNVLYRGLPNPISGSILGADMSNISLSAAGASVSGSGGKWIVSPGGGATVKLTISGKDPKGGSISQSFDFRVKNVPPPVGQVQGKSVVSMPASSIANQHVTATMPDFDFPVSFTVNSFMFKVPGKAALLVNGNSMSSVAALTKNLRNGDIAYIFNISATATGLGGQTLKQIPPIVINVQ